MLSAHPVATIYDCWLNGDAIESCSAEVQKVCDHSLAFHGFNIEVDILQSQLTKQKAIIAMFTDGQNINMRI